MKKKKKKILSKPNWNEVVINSAYAGGYYDTLDYCGKVWKKYGESQTEALGKLKKLLSII